MPDKAVSSLPGAAQATRIAWLADLTFLAALALQYAFVELD